LKIDPLIDPIKNLPETQKLLDTMETYFWDRHKQIKSKLEAKELI
jgi:hypothetical protein